MMQLTIDLGTKNASHDRKLKTCQTKFDHWKLKFGSSRN